MSSYDESHGDARRPLEACDTGRSWALLVLQLQLAKLVTVSVPLRLVDV